MGDHKLLAGFLCATVCVGAAANDAVRVESFEDDKLPVGWVASAGGGCSITNERFKSGRQSLVWNWSGDGSTLSCGIPGGETVVMRELDCLALWLYNETPSDNILLLDVMRGGSSFGSCWFTLNFKGWRPLGAPYKQIYLYEEHFMTYPQIVGMDSFRLTIIKRPDAASNSSDEAAPRAQDSGRLFIDYVNYSCSDKLRPDNQQPWVGNREMLHTDNPWRYIYSHHDISLNRPWLPKLTAEERIAADIKKDMGTIAARCVAGDKENDDPPLAIPLGPKNDQKVLDEFSEKLQIKRSPQGVITGRPIVQPAGWCKWKFNNPPDGIVIVGEGADGASSLARGLASAYLFEKKSGRMDSAAKFKEAFFDLCDHLLDQGFMEGNNNVSLNGLDFVPVFTMRTELAETGRLRDMLLASAACACRLGGDVLMFEDWSKSGYNPRNTDLYSAYAQLLVTTALLPDPSERLQRLQAYTRAISMLANPDLGEPYAWDGSVHHHPMFHIAYASGALVREAYTLRGTCFRLWPDAREHIKRSLLMLAFLSDPVGVFPPNIPGYTGQPLGVFGGNGKVMWQMALCETADSKDGVDHELAAIYLNCNLDRPDDPYVKKFHGMGVKPATFSGHKTINGSAICAHRRDGWLVTIAGQFKFRKAYEPNGAYVASSFNHYSRNGSVYVTSTGEPLSTWASGFSLEGWNSFLQPGATSYVGESAEQINGRIGNNHSAFGGGTDMDGDGIWGMEMIRRAVGVTDNMRFHKSAFCFGDRITLITTDIGRGDGAGGAERALSFATTLWQNSFGPGGWTEPPGRIAYRYAANAPRKPDPIQPERESCWVEGKEVKEFPWRTVLPPGPARWLIDNRQTGYYTHPNSPPLHVERREQEWTYLMNKYFLKSAEEMNGPGDCKYKPTKGNFATAWFDHGSKPDVNQCVYTLIPKATPESMGKLAKDMASPDTAPYVIRRMDAQAHILWDRATNTTGYLIFAPDKWSGGKDERLLAVNRICSVMLKAAPEGSMRVSVASTDLDSWPVWAWGSGRIMLSGDIVLTLDGGWEIASVDNDPFTPKNCSTKRVEGKTMLAIPFKTFMPTRLTLKPVRI